MIENRSVVVGDGRSGRFAGGIIMGYVEILEDDS